LAVLVGICSFNFAISEWWIASFVSFMIFIVVGVALYRYEFIRRRQMELCFKINAADLDLPALAIFSEYKTELFFCRNILCSVAEQRLSEWAEENQISYD